MTSVKVLISSRRLWVWTLLKGISFHDGLFLYFHGRLEELVDRAIVIGGYKFSPSVDKVSVSRKFSRGVRDDEMGSKGLELESYIIS